ncbi:hypothetical protein SALBM217S_05261 [Streptomyces griseoloalbus]
MRLRNGSGRSGIVSRSTCPFTGRTGGSTSAGTPASRPLQLPAASTTCPCGQLLTGRGDDPARPVARDDEPLGPGAVQGDTGQLAGAQQRRRQPARIDLVVAVHPQPAPHTRREHRLQMPALPPGQPLRVQPGALVQGVQLTQMGAVVGVQRHGEGAAAAVAEVQAGAVGQLGREAGVAARRPG